MKKIILCLLLLCFAASLFCEEKLSNKPSSATVRMAPFIYGDVFQPGYGISFRRQISGHGFELAPMIKPSSASWFGSRPPQVGMSSSYYYTFFRHKVCQPYVGVSYTFFQNMPGTGYQLDSHEGYFTNLIGLQFSGKQDTHFPGYMFIDIEGPAIFYDSGWGEIYPLVFPRWGAGIEF